MAENEPLTPEKQLLKLIENPGSAQVRSASVKREGKKWFSLDALKGRIAFGKKIPRKQWFSFKKFTKSSGGLERINLILKLLLVLVLGLTVHSIWKGSGELQKMSILTLEPSKTASESSDLGFQLQDVGYYTGEVRGRNIFNAEQPKSPEPEPQEVAAAAQADAAKEFSLVGIAWSKDPEAMIEDKEMGRTFFVKRGQALSNGAQIVAIFKDRVILSYNGQEIELR